MTKKLFSTTSIVLFEAYINLLNKLKRIKILLPYKLLFFHINKISLFTLIYINIYKYILTKIKID